MIVELRFSDARKFISFVAIFGKCIIGESFTDGSNGM